MKRLYVLGIMLMTIIMGHANPTIEMKGVSPKTQLQVYTLKHIIS